MPITYKKLWKLLIDKNMKKMQLREKLQISNSTLAKLSKDEPVSLTVLEKICLELNCRIEDIIEVIPEELENRPSE